MKRRYEESSLSDALTPKIGKFGLAGEMRTLEVQEARLTANLPQFFTGNISLILQCNNNTITYKYTPCFLATESFMFVVDNGWKLEKCRFVCQ